MYLFNRSPRSDHRPSSTDDEEVTSQIPSSTILPPAVISENDVPKGVKNRGAQKAMLNRRMRAVLAPLTKYEGQYVDEKMLQKFKVTCTDIDFETGQVGKTATQYTHLYPLNKIKKALEHSKPWEQYDDDDYLDYYKREGISDYKKHPQTEAAFHWTLIQDYLTSSHDASNSIMQSLTDWAEVNLPETRHLCRFSYLQYNWRLEGILRPCLYYVTRLRDTEKPHVNVFISDDAPHIMDMLSTSELTSALYMAFTTALTDRFSMHRFVPVTLVSWSGRKMRIIQCVLDTSNGDIEMRKSPTVDFKHGILAEKNETNFLKVLS